MAIMDEEALQVRAGGLKAVSMNGISFIRIVSLDTAASKARVELHFFNDVALKRMADDYAKGKNACEMFPISGGQRITAGHDPGQVKVASILDGPVVSGNDHYLVLSVEPIGDYSAYTLQVNLDAYTEIDPLFCSVDFKFRPGCFNTSCKRDRVPIPAPGEEPVIDYYAKDFDSFKHTMITAMMDRVPGWQPTSEADLEQVLIELFSAAADELSDFQDRAMNEAYLATARKRVSLARHARLMDYYIGEGCQASTWLAIIVSEAGANVEYLTDDFGKRFTVCTDTTFNPQSSTTFVVKEPAGTAGKARVVYRLLNEIKAYTWGGAAPALDAGSTWADLQFCEADANTVKDMISGGTLTNLLIQEKRNPLTGEEQGRDRTKRQVLELERCEVRQDKVAAGQYFLRVWWKEKDQLKQKYCLSVKCGDALYDDATCFYGNLVCAYHGREEEFIFKEPEVLLSGATERHFARITRFGREWGAICILPAGKLLYKEAAEGARWAGSTLEVEVTAPGTSPESWYEVPDLIHSDENANNFMVETDENGRSLLRFGNGVNGKKLSYGSEVRCRYQAGVGPDGNVGTDTLCAFDRHMFPDIDRCWNPLDATGGRSPEPPAEIMRNVPEAYRGRQLRAVTLQDYKERAEELPEVSRAEAVYAWTGSWRTVRVTVDPAGTGELKPELRKKVTDYLNAVRLIGDDLEIRGPAYVPLKISAIVCINSDYWPEDVRQTLEEEFSTGYTRDGRQAFFHPDRWTFGQALKASQIEGRLYAVEGVSRIIGIDLKRFDEAVAINTTELRSNEIIQVENDPDHLEKGSIAFDIRGGRK